MSFLDFDKIKDTIVDKGTDIISEKIKEATDGNVILESILKGQLKVDVNGYVDKAVTLLNNTLETNGLSSIDLPQLKLDFDKSIACGILLSGEVDIHDGNISGLATFCRTGDAELKINALSDPMMSAKASVGIRNANVEYSAKVNFLCFGPDSTITGRLTDATVEIDLHVDKSFSVVVNKFSVSGNGDLTLKFEDLSPYDFLTDQISEDLQSSVKAAVLEYLEKFVKEFLVNVISTLPITV